MNIKNKDRKLQNHSIVVRKKNPAYVMLRTFHSTHPLISGNPFNFIHSKILEL